MHGVLLALVARRVASSPIDTRRVYLAVDSIEREVSRSGSEGRGNGTGSHYSVGSVRWDGHPECSIRDGELWYSLRMHTRRRRGRVSESITLTLDTLFESMPWPCEMSKTLSMSPVRTCPHSLALAH